MNLPIFRRLATLFALFCLTAATAPALEIIRATYGVRGADIDVAGRLQNLVDRGEYSFPVTNRFFGTDPAPGRTKGVFVVYAVNGRQFTQSTGENQTFVFRRRDSRGGRSQQYYAPEYSSAPPYYQGGIESQVRFVSNISAPIRVYLIGPSGGWEFLADLSPGARYAASARAGQQFVVTDQRNRVIRQVSARPGGETVILR